MISVLHVGLDQTPSNPAAVLPWITPGAVRPRGKVGMGWETNQPCRTLGKDWLAL